MIKWYLKVFKRLLKCTVLNSFVVYRQVMGRKIQKLSYSIPLVEGMFTKYARAAETRSVPGRQALDNTVPCPTERHFLRKWHTKLKIKTSEEVCCVFKAWKKGNFSLLQPNM